LLSRGGVGEVWRVYDTDTDRIVAIKLLPAHFSDNEEVFSGGFADVFACSTAGVIIPPGKSRATPGRSDPC
jgi:serine/threonine protein kinase